MKRFQRMFPAAAILAGAGALAAVLALGPDHEGHASEQPPAQRRLPQPVVDTHDLMELFNKPLLQFLKEAMQEQPTGEEQWKTVRERGLQTAELANLIAIREAAAKVPQWTEAAAALQRSGLALAEAARNENWQGTQAAYRGLIQNCNNCHQTAAPDRAPMIRP